MADTTTPTGPFLELTEEELRRPFWELILEKAGPLPPNEKNRPTDGAVNHDHYLYGAPKVEEP